MSKKSCHISMLFSISQKSQSGVGSAALPHRTALYHWPYIKFNNYVQISSDPFYIVTYYVKWVTTSWNTVLVHLISKIHSFDRKYVVKRREQKNCAQKSEKSQRKTRNPESQRKRPNVKNLLQAKVINPPKCQNPENRPNPRRRRRRGIGESDGKNRYYRRRRRIMPQCPRNPGWPTSNRWTTYCSPVSAMLNILLHRLKLGMYIYCLLALLQ